MCVLVLVAAGVWFVPYGVGEYADSPDGRYRAHVSSLNRGNWSGRRIDYVRITIEDTATDTTVWRVERIMLAGESAPDYGNRSTQFITWSPDSRMISVPIGGREPAIFAVP